MNQPLSRLRLLILVVLLMPETALAIYLRTSRWIATGHAIRSLMIVVAVVLPFVMRGILLYHSRVSLRHRQFNLRALMALILVFASYLALLPLFAKPKGPNLGPSPISNSVKFEVYQVIANGTRNASSFTDPDTGTALPATDPPIITAADVSTIQLTMPGQNQDYPALSITLHPMGANKLLKATTAAKGSRQVVVVDGRVRATPRVFTPVGAQFLLTGIHHEGNDVFNELTSE